MAEYVRPSLWPVPGTEEHAMAWTAELQRRRETALQIPLSPVLAPQEAFLTQMQHNAECIDIVQLNNTPMTGPVDHMPRGLGVSMLVSTEQYADMSSRLEENEKRRIARGHFPAESRSHGLNYGFDPVDLVQEHALSTDESTAQSGTLTNDIHPLFAYEKFTNCQREVYDTLMPSLRLASHLLQHPAVSTYWYTLTTGQRQCCDPDERGGAQMHVADPVLWNAERETYWQRYLLMLVPHTDVTFDVVATSHHRYASCEFRYGSRRRLPNDQKHIWKGSIFMNLDFYTIATRLAILGKNADPAMQLRFQFFFAVSLIHECAHFVESTVRDRREPEACIEGNLFAEAGHAWECKVLGGRVEPINGRVDCQYGIYFYDRPTKHDPVLTRICYAVPMEYIVSVQQQSFWTEHVGESRNEQTILHIPRTGARSVYYGGLDMSMAADEEGNWNRVHSKVVPATIPKLLHTVATGRITKARRKERSVNMKQAQPEERDTEPGASKHVAEESDSSSDSDDTTDDEAEEDEEEVKKVVEVREVSRPSGAVLRKRAAKARAKAYEARWLVFIEVEKAKLLQPSDIYGRRRSV